MRKANAAHKYFDKDIKEYFSPTPQFDENTYNKP